MSNNNNSLIVIGIAAAVLLCGMAGAIIAISSDSNDSSEPVTAIRPIIRNTAIDEDGDQVLCDIYATTSDVTFAKAIYGAEKPTDAE